MQYINFKYKYMIGVAIAGIALSATSIGVGISQQKKAEREAEKLRDNRVEITNPYATLRPSVLGANLASTQSLRGLSTQSETAARYGNRGQSFLPQLSRQNDLVGQQNAANLDRQAFTIQQLQGRGEIIRQQQELEIYNQEQAGYSNLYNAGNANIMSGISNLGGTLASGFAQGGAFAGGGNQTPRPVAQGAYVAPTAGIQQQTFQPAQITGFQPLTNG